MNAILDHGVYDFAEAARLTGLKQSRIREWFRVRPAAPGRKPVFVSAYEPVDGGHAISFLDLIDVFVAGQLREHGVSLQTLRKVYRRMSENLGTDHPFSRQELLSDGKKVFTRWVDPGGRDRLEEVLTRQGVFPEFILPFLKRINYDRATRLAARWHIADLVVLDPKICLGKPIIEPAGVPTAVLASAYKANGGDAAAVADWYNVEKRHVTAAVDFEQKLAA